MFSKYTDTEIEMFSQVLMNINNLDALNISEQRNIFHCFLRLENWDICQYILEHQIRTALLRRDIDQSSKKIDAYYKLVQNSRVG